MSIVNEASPLGLIIVTVAGAVPLLVMLNFFESARPVSRVPKSKSETSVESF